jgi:putative transposase
MAGKRRTTEEISHVMAQAEAGVPVKELCRKYGVAEATFYAWRKKYGDLSPSELKRLKALEDENRKLKRLVADLALDKQILQDAVSGKF